VGTAKWLKNKFIAVQGKLSLYGEARAKTWVKLQVGANSGARELELEADHAFKIGDTITIHQGHESIKIVGVNANKVTLASAIQQDYNGLDHVHMGEQDTKGQMAVAVGLVDGHSVVVEGEDTEGVPMCDRDENRTCPYSNGFPGGVNLHDFAKEMRHYLEATGAANHPNCRPCRAISDQAHSGYIIAMPHFHQNRKICPKDHGSIEISGAVFKHASSINFYHRYNGDPGFPTSGFGSVPTAWNNEGRPYVWWSDPVWTELKVGNPETPTNKVVKSAFNNTICGSALAAATAGVKVTGMPAISDNVFLVGGVGLNAAGMAGGESAMTPKELDKKGPSQDNIATTTQGVGSNSDEGDPASTEKALFGNVEWEFTNNFMAGARLNAMGGALVKNNMLMGKVFLEAGTVTDTATAKFTGNVVSNTDDRACVRMWFWTNSRTKGISDTIVHGCKNAAVGFAAVMRAEGLFQRMTVLDSRIGLYYQTQGPDSEAHDSTNFEFKIANSKFYSVADGSGIGIQNPRVHTQPQGEPIAPDWWNVGGKVYPLGRSRPTLYFKTEIEDVTWVGYDHNKGARALTVGVDAFNPSDYEMAPIFVQGLNFKNMHDDSKVFFADSSHQGFGLARCIQIDCDGRRNSLIVDKDGSLLGGPGTIIPRPQKFYDKLQYVDPMGFDTMEDLIPMPARYDRFGDAIPFPSGVDHGHGGGLEYQCNTDAGCEVLFHSGWGSSKGVNGEWLPSRDLKFSKGARIVAIREDGGLIRVDPLHHGWAYATGWVRTNLCTKTMDPKDSNKPESQHARRYGRVAPGEWGTHRNASKIVATKGPVYSKAGIYRKGCTYDEKWKAYKCPGGNHRHLVIEVMDWNHLVRRWAPVSVEVNDNYAPQGGYMNIMSGPAMYQGGRDTGFDMRLQTFWALGHVGLRHNVYFSADPPQHLRLHLQYAKPEEGVIVCVYYGIPNNLVSYVNGQRKEAAAGWTTTWDNLVFRQLTPDMAHGAFYYDRVGAETGRPGYLYAVVKGQQMVDFKISHKVVLTSKIKVDSSWGGWKNDGKSDDGDDNFFKKGIDGLVRNIALLIGCPPTRIKILGNGTATKGTFWNEKTTSTEFAEFMWKQNKTMDRESMKNWLQAPGAALPNVKENASSGLSLLDHPERSASFLSQFAEHRHERIRKALDPRNSRWHHELVFLTTDERDAVHLRRTQETMSAAGDVQTAALQDMVQAAQDRSNGVVSGIEQELAANHEVLNMVVVDEEDVAPTSGKCTPDNAKDCAARDENTYNKGELVIEGEANGVVSQGTQDATGGFSIPDKESSTAEKSDTEILKMTVDNVPTKANPLGWSCATAQYQDGICDCQCGIWDPDCDGDDLVSVGVINNGSTGLSILDQAQKAAVMNWLDADGNGNGVIDGREHTLIHSLGLSALYGVAERIVRAQDHGENTKAAYRLGYFAHLDAKPSSSCNFLMNRVPFPEGMAKYTPLCIKDTQWDTVVGQPKGLCALLPEMQAGSQCHVPGSGMAVNLAKGSNDTSSVCGTMMKIFPTGGAGGILAAGNGVSTAEYYNNGGKFMPGVGDIGGILPKIDFSQNPMKVDTSFKYGMSVYMKVSFDETFVRHTRLFSFGAHAHNHDQYIAAFFDDVGPAGAAAQQVTFLVRSRRHHECRIRVDNALRLGDTDAFLFTFNPGKKTLSVWRNGHELSKNMGDCTRAQMSEDNKFSRLVIGATAFENERHVKGFSGDITDIRMWGRPVTWDVAISGTPLGEKPSESKKEEQAAVSDKCFASRKNSWDFDCGSEMTEEMAERLGHTEFADEKLTKNHKKREEMGELATCGAKISAKAVIYQGKFGDGLTAEYYKMSNLHCHQPPFLFGKLPSLVRVDPAVKFTGVEFVAPFNKLAIRWTGKILITETGLYDFQVKADDSAWVAIDGKLVAKVEHCGHGHHQSRSQDGSRNIEKGSHDIYFLYQNVGPEGADHPGTCELLYKGPDTQNSFQAVPTAKLGSAPLRLAKMNKDLEKAGQDKQDVAIVKGGFVYDDENHVGVMPKGSCDLNCQRGGRKTMAASFKFFCPTTVEGQFMAKVNMDAKRALIWLDGGGSTLWEMGSSASMVEVNTTATALEEATATHEQRLASSLGLNSFKLNDDPGPMRASAPSKTIKFAAGEHTLLFQGLPQADEAFAIATMSLTGGASVCSFYLEGRDKSPQDC
jgi:hypothetical protein